jgi:predicted ATP-dependent serine protease
MLSNNKPYTVRMFNDVVREAKLLPPAVNLYGHFSYENEVAICAGDNGVGKSILAVQAGIAIAKGGDRSEPFHGDTRPRKVLYLDYELTDRQFYSRFNSELFPDNLYRVSPNPLCIGCDIGTMQIRQMVEDHQPEVLIIDNLTTMLGSSAQDAEVAINAMRFLKELQMTKGLTVIVVAHTPKLYEAVPLKVEHVGGSKHLTNYADSVFFIAASSKGPDVRYIKHVKMRNTEAPKGVFDVTLGKKDGILQFTYLGMSQEYAHFPVKTSSKEARNAEIKELYTSGKNMSDIAETFGIDKATVSRIINPKS